MTTFTQITLKTVALASVLAAASFDASAQSNVTLYGKLDLYAQFGKGVGSTTAIQSGGQSGSRLGFKGTEDLGGGVKSLFQLEMGVGADTGASTQGGVTFGRQAFVGLTSNAGTVTLGRQYALLFNQIDSFDPFETGLGSAPNTGVVSTSVRLNNSVVYTSPTFSNVTASAMVALGEATPSATVPKTANSIYSANVVWTPGAFNVGLGLQQTKPALKTGKDTNIVLLTASYNFGLFKVTGGLQSVSDFGGVSGADRQEAFGGVLVPVGKDTLSAGAGWGKTKETAGSIAKQFSLGYSHPMSARTNVYTVASYINNGEKTAFTTDGATGAGPVTVNGKNASSVVFGIRHSF